MSKPLCPGCSSRATCRTSDLDRNHDYDFARCKLFAADEPQETHEQRWRRLGYEVKWSDLHRKYEVKWVEETSLCSVLDRTFCSTLLPTVADVDAWIAARRKLPRSSG